MIQKISGSGLKSIRVQMTGRLESDLTLEISELSANGTMNGQPVTAEVSPAKLYKLLAFFDALELPEVTVPPGRTPRGQTVFELTYQNGDQKKIGMNLNTAGTVYFELEPEQFESLMNLWIEL